MEDTLIEILALDNLVKTYREGLENGITFENEEAKMGYYEVHDRALDLLQRKLDHLPPSYRQEILPELFFQDGQE